jgi:hypothetical protein
LYINGNKIPTGKMPGYSAIINKLMILYNDGNEVAETEEITPIPEAVPIQDTAYIKPQVSDVRACIALPVNPVIIDDKRSVPIDVKITNPVKPVNPIKPINLIKPVNPIAAKEETYKSKALISDMLNDHIITEEGSTLSFKLSTQEFVVNGIKQPEPVYSRYKSKYIKPSGHSEVTWYYNYDTSSESQE